MIKAKVIRIISSKQLILNVGSDDGAANRMKFAIYSPTEQIVDPETGEVLGDYRLTKTTVEIDKAYERFSIASRPVEFSVESSAPGYYGGGEAEGLWPDLPIDMHTIKPLPTGTKVRVGDLAEEVVTVDQAELPVVQGADDQGGESSETEGDEGGSEEVPF